jgi:hypothetical protein
LGSKPEPRGSASGVRAHELCRLKPLLVVDVVDLTPLRVAEHVVGRDLLKLGLCLPLARRVLVRMLLFHQPLVRLLQVLLACVPIHLQYVVVVHSHLYFSPFDSLELSQICETASVLIVHNSVASAVPFSRSAFHKLVIVFIGSCSGHRFQPY